MALNIRHSAAVWTPPAGPGLSAPPSGAGVTGLSRTAYSGPNPISANGTTVSRKNITGNISVTGNNVTFSDCYITGDTGFAIDADSATGLTVDHCTVTASSYENNSCILTGNNWTVTNCELMRYENAIMIQGGSGLAEGNYAHDLSGPGPDPHVDGFQISGPAGPGVMIRNNWIESWDTSCIFIKAEPTGGNITGVTITGNTLKNKTGQSTAYTIYTEETSGRSITAVTITNNRLQAGGGGYLSNIGASGTTWTGNVDYTSGATISYPG